MSLILNARPKQNQAFTASMFKERCKGTFCFLKLELWSALRSITCTLCGKFVSIALQCWANPWASSCAFRCSAQVKGWEEVNKSRVLILQSAGNSCLGEGGTSGTATGKWRSLQNRNSITYLTTRKLPPPPPPPPIATYLYFSMVRSPPMLI